MAGISCRCIFLKGHKIMDSISYVSVIHHRRRFIQQQKEITRYSRQRCSYVYRFAPSNIHIAWAVAPSPACRPLKKCQARVPPAGFIKF